MVDLVSTSVLDLKHPAQASSRGTRRIVKLLTADSILRHLAKNLITKLIKRQRGLNTSSLVNTVRDKVPIFQVSNRLRMIH